MPAYNFKEKFADPVEKGDKNQTIRPRRKRPTVEGDTLYLYTGMRTKKCRLLRQVTCKSVQPIAIHSSLLVMVDTEMVSIAAISDMAKADGFPSTSEFVSFFEQHYGLPFYGVLIKW